MWLAEDSRAWSIGMELTRGAAGPDPPPPGLHLQARVRLTGVFDAADKPGERSAAARLLLRSAADVAVLEPPPDPW